MPPTVARRHVDDGPRPDLHAVGHRPGDGHDRDDRQVGDPGEQAVVGQDQQHRTRPSATATPATTRRDAADPSRPRCTSIVTTTARPRAPAPARAAAPTSGPASSSTEIPGFSPGRGTAGLPALPRSHARPATSSAADQSAATGRAQRRPPAAGRRSRAGPAPCVRDDRCGHGPCHLLGCHPRAPRTQVPRGGEDRSSPSRGRHVRREAESRARGSPAGADQSRLVREHDGLDAVAQAELGQHPADVGLDGRLRQVIRRAISALLSPVATSTRISRSRAVRRVERVRSGRRSREAARDVRDQAAGGRWGRAPRHRRAPCGSPRARPRRRRP